MTQLPSGRGLLIAEKSSARDVMETVYNKIKSTLPYSLEFEQFHGHVTQLPSPDEMREEWDTDWSEEHLPMIPTNDEWQYRPEDDPKRYKAVRTKIERGNFDFIINAGDFEREGQLIQDAFFSILAPKEQKIPIYRLWAGNMGESTIAEAYKKLYAMNDRRPNSKGSFQDLSDASFLRARFDWLLGLNSTQALTVRSNTLIRSGRVKMPILNVIVKRELEIENFVPQTFYTIQGVFDHPSGQYTGVLVDDDGKDIRFDKKDDAEKFASSLDKEGQITSVKRKTTKEYAPELFSIQSLQGKANTLYNISQEDALAAVQSLYEKQVISYPRTDSKHITPEEPEDIVGVLSVGKLHKDLSSFNMPSDLEVETFKKTKRYVDQNKVEAHGALTPVAGAPLTVNSEGDYIIEYTQLDKNGSNPRKVRHKMTDNEERVYYLVSRSLMLPFLGPVVKEKTSLITTVGENQFKTNGSLLKEEGWSSMVPEYKSKDQELPEVSETDQVSVADGSVKEGRTQPPKYYTVETFGALLENIHRLLEDDEEIIAMKKAEGLGRPATRTTIISEMIDNQVIEMKGKNYRATPFGVEIIQEVGDVRLTSPSLSAQWESKLQSLEEGEIKSSDLYKDMVQFTKDMTKELLALEIHIENKPDSKRDPVGTLPDGSEVYEADKGYYNEEFTMFLKELRAAEEEGREKPKKRGFWQGKTIKTPKMTMKGSFTRNNMKKLLSGSEIKKRVLFQNSEEPSEVSFIFDKDKGSITFAPSKAKRDIVETYKTEKYVARLIDGVSRKGSSYSLYQVKSRDAEYVISAKVFDHLLSWDEILELLEGKTLTLDVQANGSPSRIEVKFNPSSKFSIDTKFIDHPDQIEEFDGVKLKHVKTDKYDFYVVNDGLFTLNGDRKLFGHELTNNEIVALANGESITVDDLVSKAGNTYTGTLSLNRNKGRIDMEPEERPASNFKEEVKSGVKTKHIKGSNSRGSYDFYDINEGQFTVNGDMKLFGHTLTWDEVAELANGSEVEASDFETKNGNSYTGKMSVDKNKKRINVELLNWNN